MEINNKLNINIIPVNFDEKEILRNLIEKYLYEFSQYDDNDINNLGLYGYSRLDHYWTEDYHGAYFIKYNNKLAGFILINGNNENGIETDISLSEFFIIYKYRKLGIGKYSAKYIFEKFKGKKWQLKYHPKNIVSKIFWNKILTEYIKGSYEIITNNSNAKYNDGTIGEIIIFNT